VGGCQAEEVRQSKHVEEIRQRTSGRGSQAEGVQTVRSELMKRPVSANIGGQCILLDD